MVSNLTSFGQRVINNICNILPKLAETQVLWESHGVAAISVKWSYTDRLVMSMFLKLFTDNILHDLQSDEMNEGDYITMQQQSYQNTLCKQFVGRQKLLKQCKQYVHDPSCNVIVLSGKSGSGKSSLMVNITYMV